MYYTEIQATKLEERNIMLTTLIINETWIIISTCYNLYTMSSCFTIYIISCRMMMMMIDQARILSKVVLGIIIEQQMNVKTSKRL